MLTGMKRGIGTGFLFCHTSEQQTLLQRRISESCLRILWHDHGRHDVRSTVAIKSNRIGEPTIIPIHTGRRQSANPKEG